MNTDDLVTVVVYGDPQEANMAKALLADHGITSYLMGTSSNELWHIGATMGVSLQVATQDEEKARGILETSQSPKDSDQVFAWKCPNCGAEVEAGFEVCWS